MIEAGLCDAAIVGGADSLCLTTLHGFHALQLVDEGPCRPFDIARNGLSIGEAAGFALLERPEAAAIKSNIHLLGVGESSDAYHMSSPHPDGLGALVSMRDALKSARLEPGQIDYVNLHGTATRVGDAAESRAIEALFGSAAACSSSKGLTGHTLGASGIVEAILAGLSIQHNFIPASPTTQQIDPSFGINYRVRYEERRVKTVVSNSFGFGGSNCSLVLGLAE
jgi:3-oxoacyl-[acyl-carrier-protein] synthase-1